MDTESEAVNETEVTSIPPSKPRKPKAKAPAKKATVKPKAKKAASSLRQKPKVAKAKVVKTKTEKDQFGLRKNSAKSNAAAIYARKSGATLEEVKEKVGSIQLNVLKELEANGFKVKQERQERKGKRPVTRYFLIPK